MECLYTTLESKKVGIFESPTGTGKTLSILCGAMTWLRDHRKREILGTTDKNTVSIKSQKNMPKWVLEFDQVKKEDEYRARVAEFELHLESIKKANLEKQVAARKSKRRRLLGPSQESSTKLPTSSKLSDDNQYALDDYFSDSENKDELRLATNSVTDQIQLMIDTISSTDEAKVLTHTDATADLLKTKIYFASRTHSQLTQFVSQARKPTFPPVIDTPQLPHESLKLAPLGSRKQLCIYDPVAKLSSVTAMNAACMDAQKKSQCPYKKSDLRPQDTPLLTQFRDTALSDIVDVEDLHKLGADLKVCPYYGSRSIIPHAEIVILPYQLLMLRSSREALGIDLKDSVVIIDEAHNVLDAISGMHSARVTSGDVRAAKSGLETYWTKFSKRVNYGNRVKLSQIRRILAALDAFMSANRSEKETAPGTEVDPTSVFANSSAENINPFKLEQYLTDSKLVFKVDSYVCDTENTASTLVLSRVISFVLAIANPVKEGKLFWGRSADSSQLQLEYLLLDPSDHFKDIVQQSRCVVLAGGTMEPVSDYIDNLFSYVPPSQIQRFSCGHIIPKENLQVSCISHSRDACEFKFTFANRGSSPLLKSLGTTIVDLVSKIPKGVVVFLPSYQFLETALEHWKAMPIWSKLSQSVFTEPKDSNMVDKTLDAYNQYLSKHGSAILLSVVGGKMSEGINFADDMARGVIMVGLPFPNLMAAETKAKREYVQARVLEKGGSRAAALDAAKQYYENLCMRAVNQCVGRAIRHANDYAAIVFIDSRYNDTHIRNKLSGWIRSCFSPPTSYAQTLSSLDKFFATK